MEKTALPWRVLASLMLVLSLGLISCVPEDGDSLTSGTTVAVSVPNGYKDYFNEGLSFTKSASTVNVVFKIDADWTFQIVDSEGGQITWCSANVTSGGAGLNEVEVCVKENDTYGLRSAKILLMSSTSKVAEIEVEQSCEVVVLLAKRKEEVSYQGGSIEVKLESNVDFRYEVMDVSWISEPTTRAIETYTLVFDISQNPFGGPRENQIYFFHPEYSVADTLTIVQDGNPDGIPSMVYTISNMKSDSTKYESSFTMVTVERGTFDMGLSEVSEDDDEAPIHQVSLKTFAIGETEVTQELWETVMAQLWHVDYIDMLQYEHDSNSGEEPIYEKDIEGNILMYKDEETGETDSILANGKPVYEYIKDKDGNEIAVQAKWYVNSKGEFVKKKEKISGKVAKAPRWSLKDNDNSNPAYCKGARKADLRRPIEYVTWEDCQIFINRLNELTGVDTLGMTFRLPTEAEWEYAARGGNASRGYNYSGSDNANDVAWYDNNSSLTKIVKSKRANELGIYDMSGNVWEWCADWYDESYYHNSPQDNPTGPENGVDRVIRGGSWGYGEWNCRVNNRNFYSPNGKSYGIGLRLVLVPIEEVN